jgi:hypothetical protein
LIIVIKEAAITSLTHGEVNKGGTNGIIFPSGGSGSNPVGKDRGDVNGGTFLKLLLLQFENMNQ